LKLFDHDNYKWWVLIAVSLGSVSVSLDSSILIVCLPLLARVFHTDPSVIGWVNIAYLTTSQSLGLILAKIGDAKGRKAVYMTGLCFYTFGIFACSFAQSPMQLIIARAIQGVGAATGWTLTMAITVAVFPYEERGKALGILAGAYSVGLVLGPVLGGLILDGLGWRAVFWLRLPIVAAALVMAGFVIKEQKSDNKDFSLDWYGAATLFAFITCLMFFFNYAGKQGMTSYLVQSLGLGCVILFVILLFFEKHAHEPIIDLNLFRKRLFSAAILTSGLQTASTGTAIFLIPFYLSLALGYSSSVVGIFVALLAVPIVVVSPLSGKASDRLGSRLLTTTGIVVLFVAFLLLSRLGLSPGYGRLSAVIALIGTGMAIFQSPNNSAVMGSVPKDRLGTASAMVSTVRNIGSSSAIALAGTAFSTSNAHYFEKLKLQLHDITALKHMSAAASFHDTLLIAMVITTIAFVVSLVRGK
jgi:EmrB/QacA subfamily drug resistance transporter